MGSAKFRYDNVDVRTFADGFRAKAKMLRDEARILNARADELDQVAGTISIEMTDIDEEEESS